MEDREQDVVGVALQGLYATLAEVVPDLDRLVVAGGHDVWLVGSGVEFDIVDTFVVCFHGEIGC